MSCPQALGKLVVGVAVLVSAACGGAGGWLPDNPAAIVVTSTAVPPMLSGQAVHHVIPISGGCGGPYVMQVTSGHLPAGLALRNADHSLQGFLLEDGSFRLHRPDHGHRLHAVLLDHRALPPGGGGRGADGRGGHAGRGAGAAPARGTPGTTGGLPGDLAGDPGGGLRGVRDHGAGGGRRRAAVPGGGDRRPGVPDDGPLPTGTRDPRPLDQHHGLRAGGGPGGEALPVHGPGAGRGGRPRRRSRSGGWSGRRRSWWPRRSLADGVCGVPYAETFFVVDGVPPFAHELVEAGPGEGNAYTPAEAPDLSGDVVYDPPGAADGAGRRGTSRGSTPRDYPERTTMPAGASTTGGAGFVAPPEGLRLDDGERGAGGDPAAGGDVPGPLPRALAPGAELLRAAAVGARSRFVVRAERAAGAGPGLHRDRGVRRDAALRARSPTRRGEGRTTRTGGRSGLQLLAAGGVARTGGPDAPHALPGADATRATARARSGWGPTTGRWTTTRTGTGGTTRSRGWTSRRWIGVWWAPDPGAPREAAPAGDRVHGRGPAAAAPAPAARRPRRSRFGVGPDTLIVTESRPPRTHNASAGGFTMNDPRDGEGDRGGDGRGRVLRDLATAATSRGRGRRKHADPGDAGGGHDARHAARPGSTCCGCR